MKFYVTVPKVSLIFSLNLFRSLEMNLSSRFIEATPEFISRFQEALPKNSDEFGQFRCYVMKFSDFSSKFGDILPCMSRIRAVRALLAISD